MTGSIAHLEIFKYSCRKHHQQCLGVLLIITDQQHHFLKYRKFVPDARTITLQPRKNMQVIEKSNGSPILVLTQ
jgi:hypothetical protein